MDINQVKLKRLIDHIEDDGILNAKTVSDILKAKPENTNFLKEYVKAAADSLSQPELVTQFDETLKTEAEPAATTPARTEAPVEGEIQSQPEAEAPAPVRTPAKMPVQTAPASPFAGSDAPTATPVNPAPIKVAEVRTAATAQAPGGTTAANYRYRDANGISHPLRVVHERNGTILLEDKPSEEIITVTLKGQSVELNLTRLRGLPAGDEVQTIVGSYPVATLLVIADAAKA